MHLNKVVVKHVCQKVALSVGASHAFPQDGLEHLFVGRSEVERSVHVLVENICVLPKHLNLICQAIVYHHNGEATWSCNQGLGNGELFDNFLLPLDFQKGFDIV